MPRKSVKKIMKELMAKKKLTAKEKKLLMKIQKGGRTWWEFLSGKPADTTDPVDQATLTKQFDDLKSQICKVCKAAFGEDGCKCGNTAPVAEEPSNSVNVQSSPINENRTITGEGDTATRESLDSSLEPGVEPQPQPKKEKENGMVGGRRKSYKNKNKRSKRASKKMKW